MQTLAILAAKHAALTWGIGLGAIPAAGWDSLDGVAVGMLVVCIGFAVVSAGRMPSCQFPVVGAEIVADRGDRAGGRRVPRFRRRLDGLLTGMLSDDADKLAPVAGGSRRTVRPAPVGAQRFEAPGRWRGDYIDALPGRRSAASHPYPEVPARAPGADEPADTPASRSTASGGPPWPWLTATATVDGEQLWPLNGGRPGRTDKAVELDDVERALAAGQDRDDVRQVPSPAERRREAVQRFMAAPVVDLDTAREARGRAQGRSLTSAGEADSAPGARDQAASGRGGDSRDEVAAGGGETGQPESSQPGSSPESGRIASDRPESAEPGAGEPKAAAPRADESFWGPRGAADEAQDSYRSRHRPDGQAKPKPQDGRRVKPRHAAPPMGFGATLTRRLTSTKLTSKSAAHAG